MTRASFFIVVLIAAAAAAVVFAGTTPSPIALTPSSLAQKWKLTIHSGMPGADATEDAVTIAASPQLDGAFTGESESGRFSLRIDALPVVGANGASQPNFLIALLFAETAPVFAGRTVEATLVPTPLPGGATSDGVYWNGDAAAGSFSFVSTGMASWVAQLRPVTSDGTVTDAVWTIAAEGDFAPPPMTFMQRWGPTIFVSVLVFSVRVFQDYAEQKRVTQEDIGKHSAKKKQ